MGEKRGNVSLLREAFREAAAREFQDIPDIMEQNGIAEKTVCCQDFSGLWESRDVVERKSRREPEK